MLGTCFWTSLIVPEWNWQHTKSISTSSRCSNSRIYNSSASRFVRVVDCVLDDKSKLYTNRNIVAPPTFRLKGSWIYLKKLNSFLLVVNNAFPLCPATLI
jgi:hypothetical protein